MLRQDRILNRAEQRRLGAHGKQHGKHQRQIADDHTNSTQQHDDNFGELDLADQRILGEFLTKLPTQSREQKERQDKQQGTEIDQQILVSA